MKDYYALLGVGPDATPEELRRAYRDKAQAAMWDRPLFTQLSAAWEILKDPEKRAVYTRDWHAAHGTGAGAAAEAAAAAPASGGARIFGAAEPGTPSGAQPAAPQSSQQTGTPGVTTAGTSNTMRGDGGGAARVFSASDGGAATMTPPPPAAEATVAMGSSATAPGGPGAEERTQQVRLAPCPICQTPGVFGEKFCPECGFLVGGTPGAENAGERPLPLLVDARNGKQYPLRRGENVIGRERGDVVVADGTVSRRHARVFVQTDGEVLVEDLNSTNGTQRAGVPLPPGQRAAVGDGTTIQVGAVKLTVTIPDAPLALPVPQAGGATPAEPEIVPIAALAAPQDAEPAAKFVGAGGQVYALTETTTTFGRRSTNHFVLSGDPYVSGAHAQVVFSDGAFRLIDLGSTNGTSVNGRRLAANAPEPIKNGDEITLGRTSLRFHSQV